MNLAQLLIKAARTHGQRPAVSRGDEIVLTYAQLLQRVAVMAGNLRARHRLQPGDRVALVMTNCAEYMQVLFAAWFAGLGTVPINARLHPRELAWILDHSGAKLAFVTPDLAATVAPLAAEVKSLAAVIATGSPDFAALTQGDPAQLCERIKPNDLAWLFYTSGTTGRPKGAMLSHRNLLAMTITVLPKSMHIESENPNYLEQLASVGIARTGVTLTPENLDQTCLERIARFKRPKEYRFVESLPKNNYGKVLKTELRAQLAAAGAA